MADHDCRVILRDVAPKPGSPYATQDGWIVWQGTIDARPPASQVAVLYHRIGWDWHEAQAVHDHNIHPDGGGVSVARP